MKKIKFLAIVVFAMTVQSVLAQNNRIIRRHNGAVSLYNSSSLSQAIKDCEAGDTISLGKGSYSGFTIDKAITVIGNGPENTKVIGDVNVGYADGDTLKLTNRVLDGVYIDGSLSIRRVDVVKVRKCDIKHVTSGGYYQNDLTKFEFENCNIRNIFYNFKNITVINSKIGNINDAHQNGYFQNCYIADISYNPNFDGYMENCVVSNKRNSIINKGNWTNCLFLYYKNDINEQVTTDCYFNTEMGESDVTDEFLKNLPYMGTDGTMVGPFGGLMPYSLEKLNPITSVNLKVDDANQKLNVTVKLADKQ